MGVFLAAACKFRKAEAEGTHLFNSRTATIIKDIFASLKRPFLFQKVLQQVYAHAHAANETLTALYTERAGTTKACIKHLSYGQKRKAGYLQGSTGNRQHFSDLLSDFWGDTWDHHVRNSVPTLPEKKAFVDKMCSHYTMPVLDLSSCCGASFGKPPSQDEDTVAQKREAIWLSIQELPLPLEHRADKVWLRDQQQVEVVTDSKILQDIMSGQS
jgi:hypothetical protein